MPSNLAIDDKLLAEAQRVGRHKTKKETVSAALSEYVARRKQLRILELFGSTRTFWPCRPARESGLTVSPWASKKRLNTCCCGR